VPYCPSVLFKAVPKLGVSHHSKFFLQHIFLRFGLKAKKRRQILIITGGVVCLFICPWRPAAAGPLPGRTGSMLVPESETRREDLGGSDMWRKTVSCFCRLRKMV
jgi:hypothetical protein